MKGRNICTKPGAQALRTSTKTILTTAQSEPMLVETDGDTVLSSRGALPSRHLNSLQTVVRDQVH
ncbi:hypothetical protein, partial [Klebsiella quasipneumoniae]|uniref:hypothetical protein n=1 Tax=Klebsiella quasipneumoniae TaxID=1463165 RepID=UPI001D1830B1